MYFYFTIHEADNSDERNKISEATNTQNPIKPVDLITNFEELNELSLQCASEFKEFFSNGKPRDLNLLNHMYENVLHQDVCWKKTQQQDLIMHSK